MLNNIKEIRENIMKEYKNRKVKEVNTSRVNKAEKYVSELFSN